jgi:multiple sugar transport system ATP-binding protein
VAGELPDVPRSATVRQRSFPFDRCIPLMAKVELVRLSKSYGGQPAVDGIDLEIPDGVLACLLGPSGCGKTTTLRLIAGFVEPDTGEVRVGGALLSSRERTLAPEFRRMSMVFQSYALWPHMTVAENVAYGLRLRGMPREEVRRRVDAILSVTRLSTLSGRYPGELSGGQQQRAALARALAVEPQTLLLDEPLSNLDAKLRLETRVELRKLQRSLGVTTVYVTHDQEEAMAIADRMAVFMEGKIAQVGTPSEVFARPATTAVAAFIGSPPMNLLRGRIDNGRVKVAGVTLDVPSSALTGDIVVGVRPGALKIAAEGIAARVELVENMGDTAIVDCVVGGMPLKWRIDGVSTVREGDTVHLTAAPDAWHTFDAETGQRR